MTEKIIWLGVIMNFVITMSIVLALCLVGMARGAEELSSEVETALKNESYLYVATQRSNGEWSNPAPIWFMYDGEAIYFTTGPETHKARRIKSGSSVRVWVGSKDGPSFDGDAQLVNDLAFVARMGEAYNEKYWLAWLGFFRPRPERVEVGRTVVVKVTPTAADDE
jgi:general stress protein 26